MAKINILGYIIRLLIITTDFKFSTALNMTTEKLVNNIELFIFDLDGVIYKGPDIIPNVEETLKKLYSADKKIAFFTNNSALTREEYNNKLINMGINSSCRQIFTSSVICAKQLQVKYQKLPETTAYYVGEKGISDALKKCRFEILNNKFTYNEIIQNPEIKCTFVLAGFDSQFTYTKLAAATQLIARGASFYATNTDRTLPCKYGFLPGAGALINSIATVTGKQPDKVFGKPSKAGILQILQNFNITKEDAIIIGDRPETDIACGINAGIKTALVLTGVTPKNKLHELPENIKPDYTINNLSELLKISWK